MASLCLEQQQGGKYFLNRMSGNPKFLMTSLSTTRSPNCLLKDFHPYGKSLAYFIYSVDLIEVPPSLD